MNNIAFRYRLCNVFGIPLYLDFSLIFLLIFFVLGGSSFHQGVVCAALLLFSITAHELGHSLTARVFGFQTRDITLSLLGGCASLIALPRKAWQELVTAIAGPAVSFLLAALGAFAISLTAVSGGFSDAFGFVIDQSLLSFGIATEFGGLILYHQDNGALINVFLYLSTMNMVLCLFNLLPGFPMDGGRVFRSAMRSFMDRVTATYIAMIIGRVFAVLLGFAGLWRILNDRPWGGVTLLIAWMIWKEGYREYRLAQLESSWGEESYSAKVSPPPYGGKGGESDVTRN